MDVRSLCQRLYQQRAVLERTAVQLAHGQLHAESGFSRVLRHLKNKTNVGCIAIISASRGWGDKANKAANMARTRALAQDLRALKIGFIPTKGGWIENKGTPEEKVVRGEPGFAAGGLSFDDAKALAKKYNQDGFIWANDGENFRAYDKDGNVLSWGQWQRITYDVANLEAWTEIKGRKFAFVRKEEPKKEADETATPFSFTFKPDENGETAKLVTGGDVTFETEEDPWLGDTTIEELRRGDLVWWQSRWGGWSPFGCLVEVLEDAEGDEAEVMIVEDGLEPARFMLSAENTEYVSRVVYAK